MLDPERQNRFLYPPVFFVASLLWGVREDPATSLHDFLPGSAGYDWVKLVAVAITGSVLLLASGLLISVVSIGVMKVRFNRSGKPYEAWLSDEALDAVWQDLKLKGNRSREDTLYLSATLDHVLIPDRLHRWVFRRWSMFYVCANSATAIVLSLAAALILGISLLSVWPLEALFAAFVLGLSARWSWRDTMGMLNFQALHLSAIRVQSTSKTDN